MVSWRYPWFLRSTGKDQICICIRNGSQSQQRECCQYCSRIFHRYHIYPALQQGQTTPNGLMVEQSTPLGECSGRMRHVQLFPQPRLATENWFKPGGSGPDLFFTARYQHISQSVRVDCGSTWHDKNGGRWSSTYVHSQPYEPPKWYPNRASCKRVTLYGISIILKFS